jgi:hypothetical protein
VRNFTFHIFKNLISFLTTSKFQKLFVEFLPAKYISLLHQQKNIMSTTTPLQTWLDYTPCLDTDYFSTTMGQSFLTTSTTTTNQDLTAATTNQTNQTTTTTTANNNNNRSSPPSTLATNLLQDIGTRVLNGEDGEPPKETTRRRPRSYADSQTGGPISVSQVLRELRRVATNSTNNLNNLPVTTNSINPTTTTTTTTNSTNPTIPILLLSLLEHPLFRPPVGELGLSFLEQGLLTPEDWEYVLVETKECLRAEDPADRPEEDEPTTNTTTTAANALGATSTNNASNMLQLFSKNPIKTHASSSFITASMSSISRPGTNDSAAAATQQSRLRSSSEQNNNQNKAKQGLGFSERGSDQEETESDKRRALKKQQTQQHDYFAKGRGGGAARLYDIYGHKRTKPVKMTMMQPSIVPREQNMHQLCLNFETRRAVRTCSTSEISQSIDRIGPLLGPPPQESISFSFLPKSVGNNNNNNNHVGNNVGGSIIEGEHQTHHHQQHQHQHQHHQSSSSSAFLHPKSPEHNIRDIPTGSLVSLTTKARTSKIFLGHQRVRPIQFGGSGKQHHGSNNTNSNPTTAMLSFPPPQSNNIDAGASEIDVHQVHSFQAQQQQQQRFGNNLSPILRPGHHHHHQSMPNITYDATTNSSAKVEWFLRSLEIKPNLLQYNKIVLNKSTMTLSVRLQNVGITTVRFRIYSQHADIICTNTDPPGPLAPGMKSIFHVVLTPKTMELGIFKSFVHIVSQDEVLKLPIEAIILETWVDS